MTQKALDIVAVTDNIKAASNQSIIAGIITAIACGFEWSISIGFGVFGILLFLNRLATMIMKMHLMSSGTQGAIVKPEV
jgi:hypothetical protein